MKDFFFSENGYLTESTFDKKCYLTEKKLCTRLTENSFDRKFIWPKAFSKNGHLNESSYDRKLFPKNGHLTEMSVDRMFFLNCRFRKIVIWPNQKGFWIITLPKNNFTENFWPKGHLTETPFDQTPFEWMPIHRITVQPKAVRPKVHFTEKSHLAENKIYQPAENIWKMVIWPKS
jgi:hypothetical protein